MRRPATQRNASIRVVALLTDFGCAGHHAGVLRAVLLSGNPRAVPVDLCNGVPVDDWVRLPEAMVRRDGPGRISGEVVAVDHWGNLVTGVTESDLVREQIGARATVRIGRRVIRGIRNTYADAAPGAAVALVNSNGHLEIAVNRGRADAVLAAGRGVRVQVAA